MNCESNNHSKSECKGQIWECEKCDRKVCYQEGASENNLCDGCVGLNELTIRIYESVDEPGYFYDIYDTVLDDGTPAEVEPIEAGHCTTNIKSALEMAHWDARKLLNGGKASEEPVYVCMDEKDFDRLTRLINYCYLEEKRHWEESGKSDDHIFNDISELANWGQAAQFSFQK